MDWGTPGGQDGGHLGQDKPWAILCQGEDITAVVNVVMGKLKGVRVVMDREEGSPPKTLSVFNYH